MQDGFGVFFSIFMLCLHLVKNIPEANVNQIVRGTQVVA